MYELKKNVKCPCPICNSLIDIKSTMVDGKKHLQYYCTSGSQLCCDSETQFSQQTSLQVETSNWRVALAVYHDYVRDVQKRLTESKDAPSPAITEFECALFDADSNPEINPTVKSQPLSEIELTDLRVVSMLQSALLHLYCRVASSDKPLGFIQRNKLLQSFLKKRINEKPLRKRRGYLQGILQTWNEKDANNRETQAKLSFGIKKTGSGKRSMASFGSEVKLEHVIIMAIIELSRHEASTDNKMMWRVMTLLEEKLKHGSAIRAPSDNRFKHTFYVDQTDYVQSMAFDGMLKSPLKFSCSTDQSEAIASLLAKHDLPQVHVNTSNVGVKEEVVIITFLPKALANAA